MDQQHLSEVRGRSSSGTGTTGGDHRRHKSVNGHSPSPARFPNPVQVNNTPSSATGLGLGIEFTSAQYPSDLSFDPSNSFSSGQQAQTYPPQPTTVDVDASGAFDLNQDFTQQLKSEDNSYAGQPQESYSQQLLSSNFGDDFTIRLTGSNLLNAKKEEVFNKFGSTADQISRDFDEYELESEEAGPVFQLIARMAF